MPETRDLLVELGTEELPPPALTELARALRDELVAGLERERVAVNAEASQWLATPRRLAAHLADVAPAQAPRTVERRGPAVSAAFDADGQPTKAALGFARSCGVELESLERLETDKGAWLLYREHESGRPTAEIVAPVLREALERLPIPKRMRWGSGEHSFVRPVHWLVLLLGEQALEGDVFGVPAGRSTRGHRFHAPHGISLTRASDYRAALFEAYVLADYEQRRERVRRGVSEAGERAGGRVVAPDWLIDEVTALVEWPVALAGDFDRKFLDIPAEAVIATMQDQERLFPVVDADGGLLPHFVAVANVDSRRPEVVRQGYERVIRPRLADAQFFWEQDRRVPLASRCGGLDDMVFQDRLGSLGDKSRRCAALARWLADALEVDAVQAERAATLAKADLLTQMVGELPELQGTMGRYYAAADGEDEAVAAAIGEHYMPRFAGDAIPETGLGRTLALADRLDTLAGIFAVGLKPTGTKDPYALRRAALGVIRIAIEGGIDLDLRAALAVADAQLPESVAGGDDNVDEVVDFVLERLRGYYGERGVAGDVLEAVLARRPTRLVDFDRRVAGCAAFRQRPEAESLAAANKRIRNILRKAEEGAPERVDSGLLSEAAEQRLNDAVDGVIDEVEGHIGKGDHTAALAALAGLRPAVDAFFDEVLVMAEDSAVRANRLALLDKLRRQFLRIADVSRLQ